MTNGLFWKIVRALFAHFLAGICEPRKNDRYVKQAAIIARAVSQSVSAGGKNIWLSKQHVRIELKKKSVSQGSGHAGRPAAAAVRWGSL